MLVLIHVLIALASIGFAAIALLNPSHQRLRASAILSALTVASGTYLIVTTHKRILQTCVTGLIYIAVIAYLTFAARKKLAAEK